MYKAIQQIQLSLITKQAFITRIQNICCRLSVLNFLSQVINLYSPLEQTNDDDDDDDDDIEEMVLYVTKLEGRSIEHIPATIRIA